jgi:outer membrane protein
VAARACVPYPLRPMRIGTSRRASVAAALVLAFPQQAPPQAPEPKPELFGSGRALELTIDAALQLGVRNNLGLKFEDLAQEAAMYAARGSWGAFDWTLNAAGGVVDNQFKSDSVFGGSKTNTQLFSVDLIRPVSTGGTLSAHFDTANTTTDSTFSALGTSTTDAVSLSYTQPLLRGAWRQYGTAQQKTADLAWRRSLEHERGVRLKLLFDVTNAYWTLVAARADREVAESNLWLGRTQLDQDKRRLDAGVGTPIDVLATETQVATREQGLLAVDVRVREAADGLRRLILPGADAAQWETELVPTTPLPEDVSTSAAPGWNGALETALMQRPELREQRLTIESEKVAYMERVSEKRPALDLALTAIGKGFSGDSSDAFEEAARYDFPTYEAMLRFSLPIGNRTASGAERSAWANLRAANLVYDDIETQVAMELRQALRQVVYQAEAVSAASKSLDLSRRQLEAEEKRHDEGISNYFQLLTAQQDLALALSTERNARANFAKAVAASYFAQGVIGEDLGK